MKLITRREFFKHGSMFLAGGVMASSVGGRKLFGSTKSTGKEEDILRFIHVADTHLDLKMPKTVKWLEMLVDKINNDFSSIDFVLFGGDNFNNNASGKSDAIIFKKITDNLHCPSYSVRGNKESTPKPENDPLNQSDYAQMFFSSDLKVVGRDWKLKRGRYTILGIDTTRDQKDNGIFLPESLSFVENELKAHPSQYHLILNHQAYENFWGGTNKKDIHRYVLNNVEEVKGKLFKYSNLIMTLSGHKHLDHIGKSGDIQVITTVGFVVPQDPENENDHRFRFIEIRGSKVTEKLVSIV